MPNGLAPLEFPVENLDAVANPLTLVFSGAAPTFQSTALIRSDEADKCVVRWDWRSNAFGDALTAVSDLLLRAPEVADIIVDGREANPDLIKAIVGRNDTFMASYYLWWRERREDFRHA